jgi:hypothetical protein
MDRQDEQDKELKNQHQHLMGIEARIQTIHDATNKRGSMPPIPSFYGAMLPQYAQLFMTLCIFSSFGFALYPVNPVHPCK